jgi:biopolymer transport protein ExbD
MRIPRRARQSGLAFNITPLIDIVVLLIIFFLAASHLVRNESHEPVDLPEASQVAEDDNRTPRRLVITITGEGAMRVAGKAVDLLQVEQMVLAGQMAEANTEFEVRIRGDKTVPYKNVEPVMLACAGAGVTKIGYAVLPE